MDNNSKTDTANNAEKDKKSKKVKNREPEKRFRDMTPAEKKKDILLFLRDAVIMGAVFAVLFIFVFMLARIPSGSMKNTLLIEDRVFANRLAYKFGNEPERGDIIIFNFYEDEEEEYLIKRLIGLPGETVTIRQGKIYINDSTEPLVEDYIERGWKYSQGGSMDPDEYVYKVPEGHYFFLGDNRDGSGDARAWDNPYISRDDLVAKALFIFWPFSRWNGLT